MDWTNWKTWAYGLLATLINGLASGVLLVLVDPKDFNLETGFSKLATVSLLLGLQSAANYLKRQPLPGITFLLPLAIAVGLIGSGCSAKQYHIATVSVVSADATASLVQDEADASICGKPTAPPKCLTLEQRKGIAPYLSEAFDWIGQTASTIRTMGPGATVGAVVVANLARITELLNRVLDQLPSEAQARIASLTKGGGK